MSQIEVKTLTSKKELERFVEFRNNLYKDSPIDIPYLLMDEMDTLSKDKNPTLSFCDVEYYMAYRDGKPVGRVAAIINKKANETWNTRTVRFGWFDFVDDFEVSSALIQKVKDYGKSHGMDTIIGPMGFTDMDREGMLVEGFDHLASMHANHNFEYYRTHMEMMGGFEKDNDWLQYSIVIPKTMPAKLEKVSAIVEKRYNLSSRTLTRSQMTKGGYGHELFHILNRCYAHLYGFSQLDDAQIDSIVKSYIGLADMNLIALIFDDNTDKMVGFGVSFPSFSEALKKTKNGKLFPFGWYHLLKCLKFHNTKTVDMLLIAVLPEYRSKGANSLIFRELINQYNRYGFEEALTLAMMETNDNVLNLWEHFDHKQVKRLRSYKAKL